MRMLFNMCQTKNRLFVFSVYKAYACTVFTISLSNTCIKIQHFKNSYPSQIVVIDSVSSIKEKCIHIHIHSDVDYHQHTIDFLS